MFGEDIFKNKVPLYDKLLNFGFVIDGENYIYSCQIMQKQFSLNVWVFPDGKVQTRLFDTGTEEEYILHLAESAEGRFVGEVRTACLSVLQKIADNCFEKKIFQSDYADKIIQYIKNRYQDDFEYLWEKFPENAVVRRSDNKKWYAALLIVEKNKIGLLGVGKIEILDLRAEPENIEKLVDNKKYFLGYHMNKKHWMTLCLDGTVALEDIFRHIDESYLLAQKA